MAYPSFLRIPTPRAFLFFSLRTGTELVVLSLIVNKITGLYGILALFTGLHLSWLQLSMYIYSIAALGLVLYLAPHVRKQTPLQCLGLAWLYILDSLINAAYTAAFAMSWFLVLAQHNAQSGSTGQVSGSVPGGNMMDSAAGFTDPQYNVSSVDVVGPGSDGLVPVEDSSDVVRRQVQSQQISGGNALSDTILESGSIASITVISFLWAIRLYLILVVMAYARAVLRQHIVSSSQSNTNIASSTSTNGLADNPFAEEKEEGQGWPGRLGRIMLAFPRSYWLEPDDSGDWEKDIGGRFKKESTEPTGPVERERRRRAGTGPPLLRPIELVSK